MAVREVCPMSLRIGYRSPLASRGRTARNAGKAEAKSANAIETAQAFGAGAVPGNEEVKRV